MKRLSMRDGCSSASHNPLPGSVSSLSAIVPEMEVEIDERHSLAALLGEQPGAGNSGCRRTDAASAADKDNQLPQPAAGPCSRVSRPFLQGSRQGLPRRRFDQVVVGAGCEQVAEQRDIIEDTESDELQLGAANRPSRVDLGDRSG